MLYRHVLPVAVVVTYLASNTNEGLRWCSALRPPLTAVAYRQSLVSPILLRRAQRVGRNVGMCEAGGAILGYHTAPLLTWPAGGRGSRLRHSQPSRRQSGGAAGPQHGQHSSFARSACYYCALGLLRVSHPCHLPRARPAPCHSVDVDKFDYLQRDAMHCGVRVGCNYGPLVEEEQFKVGRGGGMARGRHAGSASPFHARRPRNLALGPYLMS